MKVRLTFASVLLFAIAAPAQLRTDVIHTRFDPNVFSLRNPQPLVLEVKVGAGIDRVTLCIPCAFGLVPVRTDLNDQGTGGDKTAGDRIFSATIQPQDLTAYLALNYQTIGGLVEAFNGATQVVGVGVGVVVLKEEPFVTVTNPSNDQQNSRNLVNFRLTEQEFFGAAQNASFVATRFYSRYPDSFDFLNIIYEGSLFQNRTHQNVQNQVHGIGQGINNSTQTFGSAGKLLGISRFPIDSLFDVSQGRGGGIAFLHELSHQWCCFLNHPLLTGGRPHWAISDLATAIMGYSNAFNGQGQAIIGDLLPEGNNYRVTQRYGISRYAYNDLELYLAGMAPAASVKPHLVFRDQNQAANTNGGSLLMGPADPITLGDIQAIEGARSPDFSTSQKNFRIATILLTLDRLATPEEMAYFDGARMMDARFNLATYGVGHIDPLVNDITNNFLPTNTPVINLVTESNGVPMISPNAWVEIKGVNLAPASTGSNGVTWSNAPEFASGHMPTSLSGVTVRINGKLCYVYYVSPTQVNVLIPPDAAFGTTGTAQVEVNNGTQTSAAYTVTKLAGTPALLYFGATSYILAVHADYSWIGPSDFNVPGLTFTPAKPGETIVVYVFGLGLPMDPLVDGSSTQFSRMRVNPGVTVGGVGASITFAGVIGPGLYQINFVVPPGLADAEHGIRIAFPGGVLPGGLGGFSFGILAVQH